MIHPCPAHGIVFWIFIDSHGLHCCIAFIQVMMSFYDKKVTSFLKELFLYSCFVHVCKIRKPKVHIKRVFSSTEGAAPELPETFWFWSKFLPIVWWLTDERLKSKWSRHKSTSCIKLKTARPALLNWATKILTLKSLQSWLKQRTLNPPGDWVCCPRNLKQKIDEKLLKPTSTNQ